jgi:hypothetical protein
MIFQKTISFYIKTIRSLNIKKPSVLIQKFCTVPSRRKPLRLHLPKKKNHRRMCVFKFFPSHDILNQEEKRIFSKCNILSTLCSEKKLKVKFSI